MRDCWAQPGCTDFRPQLRFIEIATVDKSTQRTADMHCFATHLRQQMSLSAQSPERSTYPQEHLASSATIKLVAAIWSDIFGLRYSNV
jgi:hypothetical protein